MVGTARLSETVRMDHVYDANGTYDGTSDDTMLDMLGFDGVLIWAMAAQTVVDASNLITAFKVVSNSASDGSGTDTTLAEIVTTDGGTTTALLAADYGTAVNTTLNSQALYLDIRADQMADGDRYLGVITTATGTIPTHFVYFRYRGFAFTDVFQATRTAFQKDA